MKYSNRWHQHYRHTDNFCLYLSLRQLVTLITIIDPIIARFFLLVIASNHARKYWPKYRFSQVFPWKPSQSNGIWFDEREPREILRQANDVAALVSRKYDAERTSIRTSFDAETKRFNAREMLNASETKEYKYRIDRNRSKNKRQNKQIIRPQKVWAHEMRAAADTSETFAGLAYLFFNYCAKNNWLNLKIHFHFYPVKLCTMVRASTTSKRVKEWARARERESGDAANELNVNRNKIQKDWR